MFLCKLFLCVLVTDLGSSKFNYFQNLTFVPILVMIGQIVSNIWPKMCIFICLLVTLTFDLGSQKFNHIRNSTYSTSVPILVTIGQVVHRYDQSMTSVDDRRQQHMDNLLLSDLDNLYQINGGVRTSRETR